MKKKNVTRKELAVSVNEKLGVSQRNAAEIVDTVFATMKNTPDMQTILHDARTKGYKPGEQRAFDIIFSSEPIRAGSSVRVSAERPSRA